MNAFEWPVRVYYEDTDAGGVVYNANYLKFLERARSEWLRALGFEQDRLMQEDGILFAVRRIEIDYLAPARFNDDLRVEAVVTHTSKVRLDFAQRVIRPPEDVLVTAQVQVVCLDAARFRPKAIPLSIREKLPDAQQ